MQIWKIKIIYFFIFLHAYRIQRKNLQSLKVDPVSYYFQKIVTDLLNVVPIKGLQVVPVVSVKEVKLEVYWGPHDNENLLHL